MGEKVFLTYMVYKERCCNSINYATAVWASKELAEDAKKKMLERNDVDHVHIQEQYVQYEPL